MNNESRRICKICSYLKEEKISERLIKRSLLLNLLFIWNHSKSWNSEMENRLFYHMMSQYHSFYHSVCWLSGVFQVSCHCYTRGEVFINHLFEHWDVKRLAVNFEHIFTIIIPLNISCLVDNDGYEPLLAGFLNPGKSPVLRLKHPSYLVTTLGAHTHLHTSHYPGFHWSPLSTHSPTVSRIPGVLTGPVPDPLTSPGCRVRPGSDDNNLIQWRFDSDH